MGKWEMVQMGDVFLSIKNGASIKQGDEIGSGYPITRIETISDGNVNRMKMGYAGIEDIAPYNDYVMESGDILMSHINSVKHLGKTALYVKKDGETVIHGMNLLRLKPNPHSIDSKYARYFFDSYNFKKQIPNITKNSVNQASFTVKALTKLTIPLPPLPVQQQIADVLDCASTLIEKRKAQIEKLDLLIKSQFIEMFGDPVMNPKGWKKVRFDAISKVRQGLQIPISKRKTERKFNCIPYITIQYLNGNKQEEYIENPKLSVMCTRDDILMTRTGNTGLVITNVEGVFHNNFFLIDYDRTKVNKFFLYYYLNTHAIQLELIRRAGTSTIPDLNHGEFYAIDIYIPPLSLQNQFADFVQQVEAQKSKLQKSLEKLELNYRSIMQKCFRGEIF